MELTDLFTNFEEERQKILSEISNQKPLVLQLTNEVTINDCANITLNWGGLPVMSAGKEDAVEMVESASALLINIGTINDYKLEVMLKAGKRANELEIPVILDPVGAGATDYRKDSVQKLLNQVDFAVIKGNQSEIEVLAGVESEMKGVESFAAGDSYKSSASQLAEKYSAVIVVTGPEDYVADAKRTINLARGDKMLGAVVGTGCMLGSSLAVFAGINNYKMDLFKRIVTAVLIFNIAGEKAAESETSPAAFKASFMDCIYNK